MHGNLAVMLTVRVEHQITERQYKNTIIFIKLIKNNRVMHCIGHDRSSKIRGPLFVIAE